MSLRPLAAYRVPEETAHVARAAFPRGNAYLQLYDEVGRLYDDRSFAAARGEWPVLPLECRAPGSATARAYGNTPVLG